MIDNHDLCKDKRKILLQLFEWGGVLPKLTHCADGNHEKEMTSMSVYVGRILRMKGWGQNDSSEAFIVYSSIGWLGRHVYSDK
jgi:hypothetical protein